MAEIIERGKNYQLYDDGHRVMGNAICYRDNDTGEWKDSNYNKYDGSDIALFAIKKPEFDKDDLKEEEAWCRKYARCKTSKAPLGCLAFRGTDGTSEKELWITYRAVGADGSVVPVKKSHAIFWENAWTDTDLEYHNLGPGSTEMRITLKSKNAPTVFKWTIKLGNLTLKMEGKHPVLRDATNENICYWGHPDIIIWGTGGSVIPEPKWSLGTEGAFQALTLTIEKAAIDAAFDAGATSVEVRA